MNNLAAQAELPPPRVPGRQPRDSPRSCLPPVLRPSAIDAQLLPGWESASDGGPSGKSGLLAGTPGTWGTGGRSAQGNAEHLRRRRHQLSRAVSVASASRESAACNGWNFESSCFQDPKSRSLVNCKAKRGLWAQGERLPHDLTRARGEGEAGG